MTHKSISIFGTRGVPANYGGFETCAHYLSLYLVQRGWDVTVYCQSDTDFEDIWNGVKRVHLASKLRGALGTALFDWRSLWHARTRESGVWLTLGYNTGGFNLLPFLWRKKQIINMDGIEWKRTQWSFFYRACLYINYWLAGWIADHLIADHPEIEKILNSHFNPHKTTMIAYGAKSITAADEQIIQKFGLTPHDYVILVARSIPENNVLEIVRAWGKRKRTHTLVVLSNLHDDNPYHRHIRATASPDVLFTGAIFDADCVSALRYYALAYVHGHTVGGTNPSLVEAMGAGNAIIARDNVFNRWVAGDGAAYYRDIQDLARIFDDLLKNEDTLENMRHAVRSRHTQAFQWNFILEQYEHALLKTLGGI